MDPAPVPDGIVGLWLAFSDDAFGRLPMRPVLDLLQVVLPDEWYCPEHRGSQGTLPWGEAGRPNRATRRAHARRRGGR